MTPVVTAPAINPGLYDKDVLDRCYRVYGPRRAGLVDVLNLLRNYKVGPEEVDGISNGAPNGEFIMAVLDVPTADKISGQLWLQNMNFRCLPLNRQVVNVKLHWLPLYVGERFVKHFLQELATLSLLKETQHVLGR